MQARTSKRPVKTSQGLVKTVTGLDRSCNRRKLQKTGLHWFGPVFCRFWKYVDRLRLWSKALGAKRLDQTGLSNTSSTHTLQLVGPIPPTAYTLIY